MASFYVIRGSDRGQHFAVRGPTTTVGRDSSNQIQLHDTEVSRRHARIVRIGPDQFEIIDTNSSNGTYVNSQRVERHVLRTGDRVQLGRTLMIFTGGPDPLGELSWPEATGVAADESGSEIDVSQIRSRLEPHFPLSELARGDVTAALEAARRSDRELLEIVYQVSQAIHRTVDLNALLRQVLDLIFQWIQCDRGYILMVDDHTGELKPIHGRDRRGSATPQVDDRRSMRISRTILDHVVQHREGVLTSNAQDDARWRHAASVSDFGIHEAICVPMLGRYGLVGAIYVDTTMSAGRFAERQGKTLFSDDHLKLLMAIAGQAALAIEDTQFYRAMMQAERLAVMGQTIANLSHHIKNILQGISGGNYLVEEGLKQEKLELIRKGWATVQRNQERISNLVMDMLSFSKERSLELARGDVREVVSDAAELAQARANELGVNIDVQLPEEPVIAYFDSESMHRALLNVVLNALDACESLVEEADGDEPAESGETQTTQSAEASVEQPRKTHIWIRLTVEASEVVLEVGDTGPGIPPDVLPRIFTPFESTKGSRGTGLGLPVTQKILREHGGNVEVESQVGRGTTFRLRWPQKPAVDVKEQGGPKTELV